jgi:hypothetical protein
MLKITRKNAQRPKVSSFLPNVSDFQKENHPLGYVFKNLEKIYSLKKCFVLQLNDAAVSLRLIIFGSKIQLFLYTDYRTDWRGGG